MPRDGTEAAPGPRLIVDLGGTHTRCALLEGGRFGRIVTFRNDAHAGVADALRAGLAALAPTGPVTEAAIAIAAPVRGADVHMTNRGWSFSIPELRSALGLARLEVVNDFTAVALALIRLGPDERVQIGGGEPLAGAARAVIGPGTGLGVSALIPHRDGRGWAPVSGEGGHITLPATCDLEARLIARARAQLGHVSAERFVSGPGLLLLHETLAAERGAAPTARTPEDVTRLAAEGEPLAAETLDLFFAFMGTVAADVALTFGALGGLYLAGGILPDLREALLASQFRARFEAKGRYREYLNAIPTYLVTAEYPGLIGLQTLFDDVD